MRCKNTSPRPLEVDRGRSVAPAEVVDVNSRDPRVAPHLSAGRLTQVSTTPSRPAGTTTEEASDD